MVELFHDRNLPPDQAQRIPPSGRQPCFWCSLALLVPAWGLGALLILSWPTSTRVLVQVLLFPQAVLGELFQRLR